MKKERNLYEYLYQSLLSQILNGAFFPGQVFPSQREICLQYNIGITTVRRVMRMLGEQGYIHTAQGHPAVVTYRASTVAHMEALVGRRDEIADAYKGLRHLMPSLYREGARRCRALELRRLENIVDGVLPEMELCGLYRQANAFFSTLLLPFNNQLIMDLQLDSSNYLHIPYIPLPGVDNPFSMTAERLKAWLQKAMLQIQKGLFDDFYDSTVAFYREAAQRVDDYLCVLNRHVSVQAQTKSDIHWFHTKGRCELFVRLAMTIIRRIVSGEFDECEYLPSIPKVMEEYGVTKDTASRAVDLLNTLGFVRTIDKKGTVITLSGIARMKGELVLTDPLIQQRLSLFLDAVQVVSLTANDCAATFSSVPKSLALFLEDKLGTVQNDRFSPVSFQLLMNCYIQLMPHYSLKNIFQQLDELILWGHYLQMVDKSFYPDPSATVSAMKDVVFAIKSQNASQLPDAFERAFSQIYQDAVTLVSQLPALGKLVPVRPAQLSLLPPARRGTMYHRNAKIVNER